MLIAKPLTAQNVLDEFFVPEYYSGEVFGGFAFTYETVLAAMEKYHQLKTEETQSSPY